MNKLYSTTALVVLAVLFVAATMLSGALLSGARVDLTEHRLYTLSEGTVNLLGSLEEPVTLTLYFSDGASADLPQIRNYATRVREMLDEMAARADGNLIVRRVDPEPFTEEEDDADRYGIDAVPLSAAGDALYLGIVGTNQLDGLEVLPFLSPARERFLEYDLARMVYSLSRLDHPRVGLLSRLPIHGGMNPQTGQQRPAWAVYEQLAEMFELETVSPQATELPADLDALVLIHPRDLEPELEYAIDQFVLGGGRLLAFVDPYAEADPGPDPHDPAAAFLAQRHSTLEPMFEAWGIELDTEHFVADLGRALQVTLEAGRPPVRHPAILGLTREELSADDVVTAGLDTINLASSGHLRINGESELSAEPLMVSSNQAGLLPTERLRMMTDPSELIDELGVTGENYILAARVSGQAPSAFPERNGDGHRASGTVNAVIVADTDLLADRLWVERQRFLGSTILSPFAGNGDLVVNAVENLLGSADLIAVRSRATATRPFKLVDSLRREAEARLRATEQRLERELQEAEQRLTELQRARGDADLSILTGEQEAEIDRFMEKRLEVRRQLRQVRRELDRDIEALGTRIKAVNIGLMPALVTVLALVLAWRRRQRQHAGSRA